MSFEIIDSSSRATGGDGYLIGHDLWNEFALGVAYGQFNEEDAREYIEKYDGYTLQIYGYNSVVSWTPGAVEGICMQSDSAGGGHCGGVKHTDDEDIAVPWGIWFNSSDYYRARGGRDTELAGIDISNQWWKTNHSDDEDIDAALNASWRISKFLPIHAAEYENDFRWSRKDNLNNINGFFYSAFYDDNGRVT